MTNPTVTPGLRGVGPTMSRRSLLKGVAATGSLAAMPGLLAACSSGGGGATSMGSNYSDEVPREALDLALAGFDGEVDLNTIDHNTYQEQINSYLQGTPDDIFAWFAGFRMQFFADQGLAAPISDVWADSLDGNFPAGFKEASTGLDGEQYFVPFSYYPWAVFYRKSVWDENGYTAPTTFDEFKSLAAQMEGDGLIPIAFADQGGWEAMGTFDYINLRTNGYDFHTALLRGDESWDSDPVRQTFENWKEILPYHQDGALGRDWQDAAAALANKEAGMYLLGLFVASAMPEEAVADLDFFSFPQIDAAYGQDTVEAPIDGFMMSASPSDEEAAKALLAHLGSAEAQQIYTDNDPGFAAANVNVDTSGYSDLKKRGVEFVAQHDNVTQFLDRDTRPDFASTVMIPSLQEFIRNPDGLADLLPSIEEQKQAIFSS